MKTQGTSKIGYYCTAHVIAREQKASGQVIVDYTSTHYIHNIELAHVSLPNDARLDIASKLQGVKMERILDNIRDSVGLQMERKHLVTKQDIHNVKRQYNIDGMQRHRNDHTSVQAWVEECKTMDYNPIVIFKQQGIEQGEEIDDVGEKDFLLGIQTEFQRDMLINFGNRVICMDTTYNTNMYDFHLITLLVLDEFGKGLPVLWAITNREDSSVLVQLLTHVQQRTGMLQPEILMSDDAEQFWNAWIGVFGLNNTKKLLCAWHVDRAWRKSLNEHVQDKDERIAVYHQLQVLLTQKNEKTSELCCRNFYHTSRVIIQPSLNTFQLTM